MGGSHICSDEAINQCEHGGEILFTSQPQSRRVSHPGRGVKAVGSELGMG